MIQLSDFQVSLSCRIPGLNIYQEGQCVNPAKSARLCLQGRERRKGWGLDPFKGAPEAL